VPSGSGSRPIVRTSGLSAARRKRLRVRAGNCIVRNGHPVMIPRRAACVYIASYGPAQAGPPWAASQALSAWIRAAACVSRFWSRVEPASSARRVE
jgi:hypothetical protein